MKRADSQRQLVDRSSQDAVKYRAAREVMEKVESRLAEEEEAERSEQPGRTLVRFLVGVLLLAWTVVMSWIAINALKKKEPRTNLRNPEQLICVVTVCDLYTTACPTSGLCR
jgi:hypothetical protein